jgi:two-component system chemotaxis sensor kinase CheA
MIPLASTFRKMIRLVHDLASKSSKKIDLRLVGEDTEVDKTVIEQISDPLVHIVRNAADHGIENPDERAGTGKPETATITIEGRHEGGEVWILITDDGRGLKREKILAKAIERGLVKGDGEDLTDEQIFKMIFEPGFSTADKVTDVSGRGVGMDVVKRNIEKLKGRIDIKSVAGKGSTFVLRIPLTLAIIEGMLVRVGEARYTIPLLTIRESFRPTPQQITTTPDGKQTVRVREDFYPVVRLHECFNREPDSREITEGILILVEGEGEMIALFVDEILGQQETVIKGLNDFLGDARGVSGCTILGDGEVSLILDVHGLVQIFSE